MKSKIKTAPLPPFELTLENQLKKLNTSVPIKLYNVEQYIGILTPEMAEYYKNYYVGEIDVFSERSILKYGFIIKIYNPILTKKGR